MLVDGFSSSRRQLGRILMLAAAVAACLSISLPAPARGSCGDVETARPKKRVNPGGRPPLAIGDSVMLLAVPNLARIGYKVNARGCRLWFEGMDAIRHYKRAGRLPHLVVVALGADWVITRANVRQALHVVGPRRVLGLVVPRESGGGTSNDARVVRRAYRAHRKRIMLLDWARLSRGHPGWFQPDGLHLTYSGASAYTKLLGKALAYSAAGEFPRGDRFPG
jgi:hypothetical protein